MEKKVNNWQIKGGNSDSKREETHRLIGRNTLNCNWFISSVLLFWWRWAAIRGYVRIFVCIYTQITDQLFSNNFKQILSSWWKYLAAYVLSFFYIKKSYKGGCVFPICSIFCLIYSLIFLIFELQNLLYSCGKLSKQVEIPDI